MRRSWYCNAMRAFASVLFFLSLLPAADQQFFELKDVRLGSGAKLAACRIGYRTFGALNAAQDNAIIFPTWFSGNSADLESFFGRDKLIDTGRFFVIAVDALGNGVSCSPSNTPGAMPRFTIGDMVQAQYRLVTERFGLKSARAVVGISMGGMQTFEWISRYPRFMKRAVPIIGSPKLTAADMLLWQAELSAIEAAEECKCDPRKAMLAVQAMHQYALYSPGWWASAKEGADWPGLQRKLASEAASAMDPRDWAAQLRAMMAQDVAANAGGSIERAAESVRAKVLVVVSAQDHMVNPAPALEFAKRAKAQMLELTGNCGHMATGCESQKMTAAVRAFLVQ
jgi:homoserine O-acetyltransferase